MAVASAAPSRLGLASGVGVPVPTQGAPLVYIAAGHGEVGLWDIAIGTCLQVRGSAGLVIAETHAFALLFCLPHIRKQVIHTLTAEEAESGCADAPAALKAPAALTDSQQRRRGGASGASVEPAPGDGEDLADALRSGLCLQEVDTPQARCDANGNLPCRAGAIYQTDRPAHLRITNLGRPHHACALLPLGGGQLLAGGSDRAIRCWEPAWPERSYQVCGPLWPGQIIEPSTGLLVPPSAARRYCSRIGPCRVPLVEEIALPGDPSRQVGMAWLSSRRFVSNRPAVWITSSVLARKRSAHPQTLPTDAARRCAGPCQPHAHARCMPRGRGHGTAGR